MSEALAHAITDIRRSLGETQAAFGARFDVTQTTVSRWESGDTIPPLATLQRIERIAGRPLIAQALGSGSDAGSVPVLGRVGAGHAVVPIDDHALGAGLEAVDAPHGKASGTYVALRVQGRSMPPFRDGWLIFYRRDWDGVPAFCLQKLCVCKLTDGRMLIKDLRLGRKPGTYTLYSYDGSEPIEDVPLEWAAPVTEIRQP